MFADVFIECWRVLVGWDGGAEAVFEEARVEDFCGHICFNKCGLTNADTFVLTNVSTKMFAGMERMHA